MKPKIPISLTTRQRYIRFRIYGYKPKIDELKRCIGQSLAELYGITQTPSVPAYIVKYKNGKGIVKTTNTELYHTILALAWASKKLKNKNILKIEKISGTLKACTNK